MSKLSNTKKIIMIVVPVILVIAVLGILLSTVIIPNNKYNDAVALMESGKYEEAITAFEALNGYKDSDALIESCNAAIIDGKYNDAVALMNSGKYNEAIAAFEALNGYKDSTSLIESCNAAIIDGKYNDAIALMNSGKYEEAISAFEALNGYKDSASLIENCVAYGKYDSAVALMESGNYAEAAEIFKALEGVKDSAAKLDNCYLNIYGEELYNQLKNINVGDIYTFGSYEQDNDLTNGKESIEWIVLDKQGSSLLLISKYTLDCQPYHQDSRSIAWAACSLRKWLIDTFFNTAFSAAEQAKIPTLTVPAHKNPDYSTFQGSDTEDPIFLLSAVEIQQYMPTTESRACAATQYSEAQGGADAWWWSRTLANGKDRAVNVHGYGGLDLAGNPNTLTTGGVRPALWIDLNS